MWSTANGGDRNELTQTICSSLGFFILQGGYSEKEVINNL
jgi:hypothetical protein